MLAKLFASHDWMIAVQIAKRVWDKKMAMEQLTILAEAMDMGVVADGDVGWLDGSIIWCEGYHCCGTRNILWLNDGVNAPCTWHCSQCQTLLPKLAPKLPRPYYVATL